MLRFETSSSARERLVLPTPEVKEERWLRHDAVVLPRLPTVHFHDLVPDAATPGGEPRKRYYQRERSEDLHFLADLELIFSDVCEISTNVFNFLEFLGIQ